MPRPLSLMLASSVLACAGAAQAHAQISLSTAVDLAVKSSPKVKMAQADVDKARAALEQTRDVFIPAITGGTNVGPPSYGFPLGTPSLFSITSQSLVFSYAQRDYIRAARAALDAANLALADARQGVMEDTTLTFLALDHDLKREAALSEQADDAARLVTIVQERLDAGQDTGIGLTTARLTTAQIRLSHLRAQDDTEADQTHLAQLVSLPAHGLSIESASVPALATPVAQPEPDASQATSPAVASAYASAHAKQETAFGDARYLWRPQISLGAQYSRFAEFNNYQEYYLHFQQNNAAIGVQINLPLYDMVHKAKARESAADAAHAQHEADSLRNQFFENRLRVRRSVQELSARAEVATLDQQLAQQQLDAIMVQLQSGTGNASGPQLTPKDEQTSRIAEREKFLSLIDAGYQMREAQVQLLRQTGGLESWLRTASTTPSAGPQQELHVVPQSASEPTLSPVKITERSNKMVKSD